VLDGSAPAPRLVFRIGAAGEAPHAGDALTAIGA
jgi:hypothetical protein